MLENPIASQRVLIIVSKISFSWNTCREVHQKAKIILLALIAFGKTISRVGYQMQIQDHNFSSRMIITSFPL